MIDRKQLPDWARPGKLRWAWWCWEPIEHYVRSADQIETVGPGSALWGKAWYERIHEEETVKTMSDLGINLAVTHFHKGMGLEFERPNIEKTKELAKIMHGHGMKVFGYMQLVSVFYEAFFNEVPEAINWIRRERNGELKQYPSSGYYWRWQTCINQQGFIDYTREVMRVGLEDVGLDGFLFDGPDGAPCYCDTCRKQFVSYLEDRFPDPRERFGIPNFKQVRIPPHTEEPQPIFDMIRQEWIRFRADRYAGALTDWHDYLKSINPDACILANPIWPCGNSGNGWANTAGEWVPNLVPTTDFTFMENEVKQEYRDGKICSQIPYMRVAQAAGVQPISTSEVRDREKIAFKTVKLDIAELSAFQGVPGTTFALRPTAQDGGRGCVVDDPNILHLLREYMPFMRDHEFLYLDAKPLNNVAVLWSEDSLAFNSTNAYQSVMSFQHDLVRSRVPYRLVFDKDIDHLEGVKALIVPDAKCLSDKTCDSIRRFVESGGKAVISETAAWCDENFRERIEMGLADIQTDDYIRTERVCLLPPNLDPSGMGELLKSMLGSDYLLETDAPDSVVVEPCVLPDGKVVVHLINYANTPVQSGSKVRLSLSQVFSRGTLHSPDSPESAVEISVQRVDNATEFTLPAIDTYTAVVLE